MKKILSILVIGLCMLMPSWAWSSNYPKQIELHYVGSWGVPAEMMFKQDGNRYQIQTNINVPFYQIQFLASGSMINNQLLTENYQQMNAGKLLYSAHITPQFIHYGQEGESKKEHAISGRVLDLFSLAFELAMNNIQLPEQVQITNGNVIYPVTDMKDLGTSLYRLMGRDTVIHTYQLQRGESSVIYGFAPEYHNIPVKITYTDNRGRTHRLRAKSVRFNGHVVNAK